MANGYDVNVSGAKAQTVVIPPVDGKDGEPLGPAGNGADGKATWLHKCEQQAGPGEEGNYGNPAVAADNGANGKDAYSVVITCSQYSGDPLRLRNYGGDGADGNTAGNGGKGSDGGNAGKQPKGCTQVIPGGVGGAAGQGGDAGSGGKAGNAGDIVVVYGTGFSGPPVSADSAGGTPGKFGNPGLPGAPGKGGIGSDGTPALDGPTAGGGKYGTGGDGGYGGSFDGRTDPKAAPNFLKITVQVAPSS